MKKNAAFLILWILAVLTTPPEALTYQFAQLEGSGTKSPDKDYFYCGLLDESQSKRFFLTMVFSGDNSDQRTYETQFSAYVAARYNGVSGTASCRFDQSRSVAMMRREDDKTAASRENRAVIETNWRP